jgi:hypothetical protein
MTYREHDVFKRRNEELVTIREDVVGRGAHGQQVRGHMSKTNMVNAATAHPLVRFQEGRGPGPFDKLMEMDLHRAPDGTLSLHFYCPRCTNHSVINGKNKRIEWDGENLHVEPFECMWELENTRQQSILAPGANLCRLRMGISYNIGRKA